MLTASGAVTADGNYNMRFKIYQDGNGCNPTSGCSTDPSTQNGGTLKWTEEWLNSNSEGVVVKNGYFSVTLGTYCPFDGSACGGGQSQSNAGVDWDQDSLWLSMNVGGTGGSASYDGEMIPFKRLASAVYALQADNSNKLGGIAAANYLQFGTGTLQADSSTNSSIYFNKTNTGNLMRLQTGGSDAFVLDNSGNLQFGNNSDKTISVANASSANGNNLTIVSGSGNGSSKNGGDLVLEAGAATSGGTGGHIVLQPLTDSTTALQVRNAAGTALVTIDTINDRLSANDINSGAPADVGSQGHLFAGGFESGNTGAWTDVGGTGTGAVVSTIVRSGKYAFSASTTSAHGAGEQITIPSSATVYGRTYFNTTVQADKTPLIDFGTAAIGSGGHLYIDTEASNFLCYHQTLNGTTTACSATAPSANTWHKLEAEVVINGASSTLKVWLDGAPVTSGGSALYTTTASFGGTNVTNFAIGNNDAVANATTTTYFDDVAVDTVSTGDSASTYVADAFHASGNVSVATSSQAAFQVQNAAGTQELVVDSVNDAVNLKSSLDTTTNTTLAIANNNATGVTIGNNGSTANPTTIYGTLAVRDPASASNSSSLFQVQNNSGYSLLGVDASASQVLIGSASQAVSLVVSDGASGYSVTLQTSGSQTANYAVKFPTSAPSSSGSLCLAAGGTGTPVQLTWSSCGGSGGGGATHYVKLAPEYPDAVLNGTGNGNLTSGWDSTNRHNYYKWSSTQGTTNTEDVVVRTAIPSEYTGSLGNFTLNLLAHSNSTTNDDVQVTVYDGSGTACATNASFVSSLTNDVWGTQTVTLSGCTFAANDFLTIRITLSSKSSNYVEIGEISYSYSN